MTIVAYSDHSQVTHLLQRDLSPENARNTTNPVRVLLEDGAITLEEALGKKGGFFALTFTSLGTLHWRADTVEERQRRAAIAKSALEAYTVTHPLTGTEECPWLVLDHAAMKAGIADPDDPRLAVAPGELWHEYFGPQAGLDGETVLWADLILLMRHGWQLPVLGGNAGNIGIDLPFPVPPVTIFVGGHGGPDTQPILMAVSGPGIANNVVPDPDHEQDHRIADLAVTMARWFDLDLGISPDRSDTVGRDRSGDLRRRRGQGRTER